MRETPGQGRVVPALPTFHPRMLLRDPGAALPLPFSAPRVRYAYLARNAVYHGARLLGLEQGDVLVPAYHHGVEVEALAAAGAGLRFYPVGAEWQVDPEEVRRRIDARTRAIYLIHYAGFPGPWAALRELADRHRLALIEDCALSLLSRDGAVPLGSVGDLAVFCLYKTLPAPHGGALVVNRQALGLPPFEHNPPPLATTVRHLGVSMLQRSELRLGRVGRVLRASVRAIGRRGAGWGGLRHVPTGTSRLERAHLQLGISPLALRVGRAQDFEAIVSARRRNYFYLLGRLRDLARPLFSELPSGVCPLFYPLRVADKPAVLSRLWAAGVEAVDFWSSFHPACPAEDFPEVMGLRRELIELPCHQDLGPEDMERVVEAAREALGPAERLRAWG